MNFCANMSKSTTTMVRKHIIKYKNVLVSKYQTQGFSLYLKFLKPTVNIAHNQLSGKSEHFGISNFTK